MTLRNLIAVSAMVLTVLALPTAALATPLHETTFAPTPPRPDVWPDRPIVAVVEGSAPCAAPAFAQPIDDVDEGLLADTGWNRGLQLAGLAALALAALLAPSRLAGSGASGSNTPFLGRDRD